eukprot:5020638-Amphidinium_carterae.1
MAIGGAERAKQTHHPQSLPDYLFQTRLEECSISDSELDSLLKANPDFATLSPQRYQEGVLRQLCMKACKGDWSLMCKRWCSYLLTPGTLVYHKLSKKGWVVVYKSQWGALGLACSLSKVKQVHTVQNIMRDTNALVYLDVADPAEWLVTDLTIAPPSHDLWRSEPGQLSGIYVTAQRKGMPIMTHAVMSGLKGWTRPLLEKLWQDLNVPQPSGSESAAASAQAGDPTSTKPPKSKSALLRDIIAKFCKTETEIDSIEKLHDGPVDAVMEAALQVSQPSSTLLKEENNWETDEEWEADLVQLDEEQT